jgi:hypothetical protein
MRHLPDASIASCTDHYREYASLSTSPPAAGDAQEIDVEPLEFRWTKTDAKIRAAVKAYCEETYADY